MENRERIKMPMAAAAILAVLCFLAGRLLPVHVFKVEGSSMNPTYRSGEFGLCIKAESYDNGTVVLFRKEKCYVKRVVAGPGDSVLIKNEKLCVNGKEPDWCGSYASDKNGTAAEPIVLGEGEYFVLGDNRDHSTDSRSGNVGIVKYDEIIGRVLLSRSDIGN